MGNAIACVVLCCFYGAEYFDLGPFCAICWDALESFRMEDPSYGWTVEMQIKAACCGLRYVEVLVLYCRRIGVSKVSGMLRGIVLDLS